MVGSPSLVLAFAAGFVSFVSPCCLPLVPGYLATVSGARPDAPRRARLDPRVLGRSGLFVASFSGVFILLGLGATAIGGFLFANRPVLDRISGVAIMVMGVLFIGSPRAGVSEQADRRRRGPGAPRLPPAAHA
jgi:cytochrome c-type biogenesis protein